MERFLNNQNKIRIKDNSFDFLFILLLTKKHVEMRNTYLV